MVGDPDRKATGFSVGHLPESSAITPGGKDTYKDATRMDGDPDRQATGSSVGHWPKSSVITPGGKDTYEDGTRIRVTFRDPPARQQDSASGASQSYPITPRRTEYARRESSKTSRAVQTHTVASGDSIRNAPDELV